MRNSLYLLTLLVPAWAQFQDEMQIDTAVNYIQNTPSYTEEEGEIVYNLRKEVWAKGEYSLHWDFYIVFRVLHKDMIPLWTKIAGENRNNILIQLWYITALMRLGDTEFLPLIAHYRNSENEIFREYAANAYGTLGSSKDIQMLREWIKEESNGFVRETLKSSVIRIEQGTINRIDYLPYLYKQDVPVVTFFYNVYAQSSEEYQWNEQFSARLDFVEEDSLVYPHQQYSFPVKNAPKGIFGKQHGSVFHVGEDTGWLLEGLPIHSIAHGVVRLVQHDLSWGTMIVIESNIRGTPVTHLYAHLAEELDVLPGDMVYPGQKIGTIGRSVSYENGGYWAHVHIGIELETYEDARIIGYDSTIGNYVQLKELMKMNNDKKMVRK